MARRALLVVVLLASFPGCVADDTAPPVTRFGDSAGIAVATSDPSRLTARCSPNAEPRVSIGVRSGEPEYELYGVYGATVLSNGNIAVVDRGSYQVRVYDARGTFVRAFGRRGGGPGEFDIPYRIWATAGDTLWVSDYNPWRYHVFTADGHWVRSVRPDLGSDNRNPIGMEMLAEGRPLVAKEVGSRDRTAALDSMAVIRLTRDGGVADTIAVLPWTRHGQPVATHAGYTRVPPLFGARTVIGAYGSRIAMGTGRDPEVSVVDVVDGEAPGPDSLPRPSLIVRWQAGDRTVEPADIEAEHDRIRASYEDVLAPRSVVERRLAVLLDDDRPVADRFPAYSDLYVARDSALWVKDYPRPRGPATTRSWLVFDPDGALRCRANLPRFEVFEIGPDWVLGLHTDELGVERVVLYDVNDRDSRHD